MMRTHDSDGFTYLILLILSGLTLIEIPGPDLDLVSPCFSLLKTMLPPVF